MCWFIRILQEKNFFDCENLSIFRNFCKKGKFFQTNFENFIHIRQLCMISHFKGKIVNYHLIFQFTCILYRKYFIFASKNSQFFTYENFQFFSCKNIYVFWYNIDIISLLWYNFNLLSLKWRITNGPGRAKTLSKNSFRFWPFFRKIQNNYTAG